jgi:hypothetical protein
MQMFVTLRTGAYDWSRVIGIDRNSLGTRNRHCLAFDKKSKSKEFQNFKGGLVNQIKWVLQQTKSIRVSARKIETSGGEQKAKREISRREREGGREIQESLLFYFSWPWWWKGESDSRCACCPCSLFG